MYICYLYITTYAEFLEEKMPDIFFYICWIIHSSLFFFLKQQTNYLQLIKLWIQDFLLQLTLINNIH
jgi:hypothetical protein